MTRHHPRRAAASALALALTFVLVVGCSKDSDDTGRDAGAAVAKATTTLVPTVDRCGGLSDPDIDQLGISGLEVVKIQDVSTVLQGPARGGHGCWFDLKRKVGKKSERTSLTVLVHPTGQSYIDAAKAKPGTTTPVPGLGEEAFTVGPTKDSRAITVITRRGPLVVEAEIGDADVMSRDLLIAIAGLALERA